MCWKYEGEYGDECFDNLMLDTGLFTAGIPTLLGEYGVKITDKERFREMLYMFLEMAHEAQVIVPEAKTRKELKMKYQWNVFLTDGRIISVDGDGTIETDTYIVFCAETADVPITMAKFVKSNIFGWKLITGIEPDEE
jgi:hypothetical protein